VRKRMIFQPKTLDYKLSSYTGLTRESWIEASEYLLTGIFQHIKSMDDPVIMPRCETAISYPQKNSPKAQLRAEYFEGLARSFFIAAPLIHIKPDVTICGFNLREYYKLQVIKACTPGDTNFVGSYSELKEWMNNQDEFAVFQQTVETCSLVVCLQNCKSEIWDHYTQTEKDVIAEFISGFAHKSTVPQNWRLFNMLDLAFLHQEGYLIDHDIMRDHAQAILNYYTGDGWYRDGHSFDYYSCWAFQVYAPMWNQWYGYKNEPYLAKRFEENSNKLMKTYADLFDRDGFTTMWGRSNIYRNAATSVFEGNLILNQSSADPGLARRIASGSLLQFLSREDFLNDGIPTLGFYGQFAPLVQSYSCAESPFWLGKVFLFLHLPKDHPFWTEKEHNGSWEKLGTRETKETVLNGPALCFSNHQANGEMVLRTGKVVKRREDEHGMWNYSKLCYNSKFPWEAAPSREIESQQYVLKDPSSNYIEKGNITLWHGERENVLYRRQFFNYELTKECHWMQAINLADFVVPFGVMRVDKLRLYKQPIELTLGAYGFPDQTTDISMREKGMAKAIILKGYDFTGRKKQLAMTIFDGWDDIHWLKSVGTNPDSQKSIIIYASLKRHKHYGYEPYVLISQVVTKDSHDDFLENDIFPIQKVEYTDPEGCGGYGPIHVYLKDGTVRHIDFEGIEGSLSI